MAEDGTGGTERDRREDQQRLQVGAEFDCEQHEHREHRDHEAQPEAAKRFVGLLLLTLPANADRGKLVLEHRREPAFQFLRDLAGGEGRVGVDISRDRDRPLLSEPVDLRIATGHVRVGQFAERTGDAVGTLHTHVGECCEAPPLFAWVGHHQFHLVPAPLQPHHLFSVEARPDRRGHVRQRHSQRLGLRLHLHLVFPLARPGIVIDVNHARILGQPAFHPLDGGLQLPH